MNKEDLERMTDEVTDAVTDIFPFIPNNEGVNMNGDHDTNTIDSNLVSEEITEESTKIDSREEAIRIIAQSRFSISNYPGGDDYPALYDLPDKYQRALAYLQLNHSPTEYNLSLVSENGEKLNIPLVPGVTLVYGASGSGKTLFTQHLAKTEGAFYIRFQEPEIPAITSVTGFIEALVAGLVGDKEVIVVDSFRFLLYNSNSKAAAMSGGINSTFFTELTGLHLIAASLNKKLVIVANFLSEGSNNKDVIRNAISGSVGGFFNTFASGDEMLMEYNSRSSMSLRKTIVVRNPGVTSKDDSSSRTNDSHDLVQVESDDALSNFTSMFRRILLNK